MVGVDFRSLLSLLGQHIKRIHAGPMANRYQEMEVGIRDTKFSAFIPYDPRNSDYQAYIRNSLKGVKDFELIKDFICIQLVAITQQNYGSNFESHKTMGKMLVEFGKILKSIGEV